MSTGITIVPNYKFLLRQNAIVYSNNNSTKAAIVYWENNGVNAAIILWDNNSTKLQLSICINSTKAEILYRDNRGTKSPNL